MAAARETAATGHVCVFLALEAKASHQHDPAGHPYRSFRGLLEHLATLTRNQVRFAGTQATIPMLAEPSSGAIPPMV